MTKGNSMVDLVIIKNGEAVADSRILAEKFVKSHDRVLKSIDKLSLSIENLVRENKRTKKDDYIFNEKTRIYKGRDFRYFEMNRNAFSILAMGFTGKKAIKWKIDFIEAFNLKKQREQGKEIKKDETDTIKKFVEYAINQGSKSAQFYYKHFTSATYKTLQLVQSKKPKLRDTLDTLELNQLLLAENIAMRSLEENMKSGEHYKEIFVNVKNDIEKYAGTLFLPKQQ